MAADANGVEVTMVIKKATAVLQDVFDLVMGAEEKVRRIQVEQGERAERAAASHLPDLDEYERLSRYKRSHERSLEKWVALLEASQRARSGDLAPPIRLHVSEG